ncbi:AraC family transcriptional regulator [Aquimarina sp. ERC-38]|uniref:AraC family transcriptional regulator n=1 Tax=Aquimarina sp. ERC-38 TaxID=2949996 RepID=UPI002246C81C|nr:AraC family transcriptional regulator [Aquimarina sp. ERC-38]UZO81706.1 AraC family transcriptional regulator [Aquimarina sp. ERC-38]
MIFITRFAFLYFVSHCYLYSQDIESNLFGTKKDTLLTKSYDEIYKLHYDNYEIDSLYNFYAKAFIRKAYEEKDTARITIGYYVLTYKNLNSNLQFNDSLIKYANMLKSYQWSWQGYDNKGVIYNDKRNFQLALINHVKAYNIAKEYGLKDYQISSLLSLGILKERIGRYEESLQNFKLSTIFLKEKIEKTDSIDESLQQSYLNNLHILSNSYRLNKKLDSAKIIINEAKQYQKFEWAFRSLNKIKLNEAEIDYDSRKYKNAIKNGTFAISHFIEDEDEKSVAACYYIIGMSHFKLGYKDIGIDYLIKMDSIYSKLGSIYPPVRSGYENLISYFKKKKYIEKQLYFVNQLLHFDSIAHDNYTFIYEHLVNNLEKPELLKQKEELTKQLKGKNKKVRYWVFTALFVIIILLFEIVRRKKLLLKKEKEKELLEIKFQKRFDDLVGKTKKSYSYKSTNIEDENYTDNLEISKPVVSDILKQLKRFEENQDYINSELTATILAKQFNTNANYLGRIVKFHHHKSFRQYVNDLRIDFALDQIRNNLKFRNYSISAIAKEVGFKNTDPFTKAFKNKVGINPSDFLKKISK